MISDECTEVDIDELQSTIPPVLSPALPPFISKTANPFDPPVLVATTPSEQQMASTLDSTIHSLRSSSVAMDQRLPTPSTSEGARNEYNLEENCGHRVEKPQTTLAFLVNSRNLVKIEGTDNALIKYSGDKSDTAPTSS